MMKKIIPNTNTCLYTKIDIRMLQISIGKFHFNITVLDKEFSNFMMQHSNKIIDIYALHLLKVK